jgi:hypothetical protein
MPDSNKIIERQLVWLGTGEPSDLADESFGIVWRYGEKAWPPTLFDKHPRPTQAVAESDCVPRMGAELETPQPTSDDMNADDVVTAQPIYRENLEEAQFQPARGDVAVPEPPVHSISSASILVWP